jgi:hypothetical protein
LQRAVELYITAQARGDTSGLPLATGLGYMENIAPANIDNGLIKTAMKVDHHRSLLDPATCQTFTEVDRDEQGDVGVPSGVNIANRRFIVEETIGSVAQASPPSGQNCT